jgi:hypothetical protein
MHSMLLLAERIERAERERGGGASNTLVILAIAGAIVMAVLGRVVTHNMDRRRIARYGTDQGWELLSCQWKLFGPGWFGSNRERIYAITYRDGQGRTHSAFAKTSALAGVYLTEDRVEG